jgi:ketosteroid isomerase-like protein
MSEQSNTAVVQGVYEAFGRGDVPSILNSLADNVEWGNPGPVEILPWAKVRHSRDEVVEFFQALGSELEFEKFEPREFIAQGDRVVALGYFKAKSRRTGKSMEENWAMEWTVKDGKITQYRAHDDTFALARAMDAN